MKVMRLELILSITRDFLLKVWHTVLQINRCIYPNPAIRLILVLECVRECENSSDIIIPTKVGIQRSCWYCQRYWIPSFDGMMNSGAFCSVLLRWGQTSRLTLKQTSFSMEYVIIVTNPAVKRDVWHHLCSAWQIVLLFLSFQPPVSVLIFLYFFLHFLEPFSIWVYVGSLHQTERVRW